MQHLVSRKFHSCGLIVAIAVAWPSPAFSRTRRARAPTSCVSTYQEAHGLEVAGRLQDAQRLYLACTRTTCGALLRNECQLRYTQLAADIPSVIPVVTDAAGRPVTDVRVTIDGEALTARIDGRAIAVDPGVHTFAFEMSDGAVAARRIVILQGQRNLPLAVSLRAGARNGDGRDAETEPPRAARGPAARPEDTAELEKEGPASPGPPAPSEIPDEEAPVAPPSGHPALPYLLGGVGVAALGGAGLLTYWGRRDNDLLAGCTPACPAASVDHIRKLYLAADVALGVGVAALAVATITLVSHHGESDVLATRGYRFDLRPTASGALACLAGAF